MTLAEVPVLDPIPILSETAHRLPLAGLLDLPLNPLTFKPPTATHCLEWAWQSDLIG